MSTREIFNLLHEARFVSGLSDDDLFKLAGISELVNFAASTVIFSEGNPFPNLFLLLEGRVQLCMSVPAQGCIPLLTLESGDLLGWSPALAGNEMTATAIAIQDTRTIRIAADRLQALCEEDHDIGYELMRRIAVALSQRLVATRLQVLDLFVEPSAGMP